MKLKIYIVIVTLVLFCCLNAGLYSQDKSVSSKSENNNILNKKLMFLDVSIWNKKKFIKNLQKSNFEVFVKKKKLKIKKFKQTNEPVSIGVLFDASGSSSSSRRKKVSELPLAVDGLIRFINHSNLENEYFFVSFAKESKILLEFTQDTKLIEKSLKNFLVTKPYGNTSLFDAMKLGYKKVLKGKNRKKVLIVISDWQDNSSTEVRYKHVKKWSKKENVQLYMVNILRKNEVVLNFELNALDKLKNLAENSGGRVLSPKNLDEIHRIFYLIAEELKSQYMLEVEIDKKSKKELWHKLDVKINLSDKEKDSFGKVSTLYRKGYYY